MANTPYYSKAEADQKNKETFREVESTVNSISAGEGGILYDTVAEAQGLATKPQNGTVFQVKGLGYYTFQSSETGGTRFEREYPPKNFSKGYFDATATINKTNLDVFKAVKRVELYGADPTKRYFLKYFGRNRDDAGGTHEGKYYFNVEEEGRNTQGICAWNEVLTENPNGVTEMELLDISDLGITGKAWVNWDELDVLRHSPFLTFDINIGLLSNSVHHAKDAKEKINQLEYKITPEYEFGGIVTDDGSLAENNIRVRTKEIGIFQGSFDVSISLPAGFVASNHIFYDQNGVYVDGFSGLPTTLNIPNGVGILRVGFRKSDGSVITQSEIDLIDFDLILIGDIGYAKLHADVKDLKNTNSNTGKWSGKKLAVLGDSISYGFIPRNVPEYPGQLNSYAKLTAQKLSMTFQNKGINGSTLGALTIGNTANAPFVYRYQDLANDADVILVKGGTNDIRKIGVLGTINDTDETTYYGALHLLCLGLLDKYRHAQGTDIGKDKKIVLITPIKLNGNDIMPYANAVKEVGAYYSIPVWDAYNLSGINPHILKTVQGYEGSYTEMYNPYITDGTHPTQEGHEMMAQSLAGFLNSLLE